VYREIQTLIAMLGSPYVEIRANAVQVLGNVGAPAVRLLVQALNDGNGAVRASAARALMDIGDAQTLPRKVLADPRLSARRKARALEVLRRVDYHDEAIVLRYPLPEIPLFCDQMLADTDAAVQAGARAVLGELQQRTLLRPSQRDEDSEEEELLRAAQSAGNGERPDTLLRSTNTPLSLAHEQDPQGLLARLFRRR
jgi:HEAT repeat protein